MPEISYLVKILQDKSHKNRYEACEELRVSKLPLPQEAIDALIIATKDTDPDVADAARRALALHTSNPILTASVPADSKSNTAIAGVIIVTIIILFLCLSIVSDTSPEAYERNGNLVMAAMVFGMALFIPLIILILLIVISTVFKSDSKIKLQEKINNTPPAIAKNDKNPDVADLTVGNLTTQELSNTSSNEKKSKKEDQIDLLPIAVIGGIVLIITLLMSLPYLLSYL